MFFFQKEIKIVAQRQNRPASWKLKAVTEGVAKDGWLRQKNSK